MILSALFSDEPFREVLVLARAAGFRVVVMDDILGVGFSADGKPLPWGFRAVRRLSPAGASGLTWAGTIGIDSRLWATRTGAAVLCHELRHALDQRGWRLPLFALAYVFPPALLTLRAWLELRSIRVERAAREIVGRGASRNVESYVDSFTGRFYGWMGRAFTRAFWRRRLAPDACTRALADLDRALGGGA